MVERPDGTRVRAMVHILPVKDDHGAVVASGTLSGFFFGASDGSETWDDLAFVAKAGEALGRDDRLL